MAIHALLFGGALFYLETQSEGEKPKKPFQVELMPAEKTRMLVVDSADINENLKKEPKVTRLSDKKRRVRKETRRANPSSGLTVPSARPSKSAVRQKMTQETRNKNQNQKIAANKGKNGTKNKSRERKPLQLPFRAQPHASTSYVPNHVQQSLPEGIELGNITALNTDQHLYYNFHSRLIGRFAPVWGSLVGKALYQWLKQHDFPSTPKSWVTNVEVILNEKGEVLDVQHYRLSGLWPFDEAPLKAFKIVKQIPNPPAEMVDENGYIRLKFQTEVHWRPQPKANFGMGSRPRSY